MDSLDNVYDLVIIGGGSAGLSAVEFGTQVDARIALIERRRIGGDCTWTGCVPSKSLLKAAKVAYAMRTADRYGIAAVDPEVDMRAVMARVQAIIAEIYAEETPEVLRERGVDVFLGEAHFVDPDTLVIQEEKEEDAEGEGGTTETTIKARNVILCTGAHPFVPPIEGLDAVDYLTHESIWHLETLPEHLIVIGGGPIGSEMSQAFRRLGAEVSIIEGRDRVLGRDDPLASETMAEVFESEGIRLYLERKAERVWQDEAGIHVDAGEDEIVGDALLVAVGRRPNVEGLDLEQAGVAYTERGIEVNDKLCTTQSHIYAAGDCIGGYQFTHYAGWQAAMAVRNALLPGRSKGVRSWVPWTTFTDPEVAHAGLTVARAEENYGDEIEIIKLPMTEVDRARAESDTAGVVQLVHKGGKVLGVTLISDRAGELIHEWMHVLEGHLSVSDVTTVIHVYPTYSGISVEMGGAFLRKRLLSGRTGRLVYTLSQWLLKWMRWWRGF